MLRYISTICHQPRGHRRQVVMSMSQCNMVLIYWKSSHACQVGKVMSKEAYFVKHAVHTGYSAWIHATRLVIEETSGLKIESQL